MKNYDESVEMNHNSSWSYILDHPYKNLITNSLALIYQDKQIQVFHNKLIS